MGPEGQVLGAASCPRRTVPVGGGIASASTSVAVNVYYSLPTGTRWQAGMSNGTAFDTTAYSGHS